ncbi:MAG TPA: ABC transporter ATP-binding protein [Burkholderiales bacterium]|nr:ABC transporter ATP-binding protein [Burkholderiales bacterium]
MAENLRLERVSLAFGGLRVLHEVSFETRPGELLSLIGPNGAGKTSVLNCICGLYRATGGRIFFGAVEITRARSHQVARLGVARTFQHGELFAHLTVVENLLVARHARIATRLVAEGLALPGARATESHHRRAVEEVLEFTDLERYRHRRVDELPFGIQKIVGFARALAMEPSVLLLDEPSAGLSRDEREDLARYILRIKHELGIPIVWVEHDMQMVADLADRIYVLDHGEPIAEGPPAQVLSHPEVVRAYLGSGVARAGSST